MGNRVDDLEKQVAELQAAVDGLTEELVEAKERISQLEQSTDVEEPASPSRNPNAEFVPNESATNGSGEQTQQKVMADDENNAQKAARGADGESESESESSEDDSDDIIVA